MAAGFNGVSSSRFQSGVGRSSSKSEGSGVLAVSGRKRRRFRRRVVGNCGASSVGFAGRVRCGGSCRS
eukprot:1330445-Prorocentrum_lima.AAC.1